jgi:hypothetical protein
LLRPSPLRYNGGMEVSQWLAAHWFDCIQIVVLAGGLLLTAYTIHKDARARQISNLIALNERHDDIWRTFYERPQLARVLKHEVDLKEHPISDEEWLFVKMLFIHLDTVRRTANAGMFIQIRGIRNDLQTFINLPIPSAVWKKLKPFQDEDFVTFVDGCLNPR